MYAKFVFRIVIATITVFMISNIIILNHTKKEAEKQFLSNAEQFTTHTKDALNLWAQDQLRMVKQIASDGRIISLCLNPEDEKIRKEAEDYLKGLNDLYTYYENLPIAIINKKPIYRNISGKTIAINEGTFLIDTRGGATVGKGGERYSYIKNIIDGHPYYFSEIYRSIVEGNPILVVSAPIYDYDGNLIGISIVSPKMYYFTEVFVDQIKMGKTGFIFFVDNEARIISHSDRSLILSEDPSLKRRAQFIIEKINSGETYFTSSISGNSKYYYGIKYEINKGNSPSAYFIVYTQNTSEVYAEVYDYLQTFLLTSDLSIFMLILLISMISRVNQKEMEEIQLINNNKKLEEMVEKRTLTLKNMAITDGLTGLFNHQYTIGLLKNLTQSKTPGSHPVVVILCDLDFFKRVNDEYGHQAGDAVLRNISQVFKNALRETDIAGRYGGEEFLFILPDCTLEGGKLIAERIRKEVEASEQSIKELKVTVSLGVVQWSGEEADDLIKKADLLLYRAKAEGRNRTCF